MGEKLAADGTKLGRRADLPGGARKWEKKGILYRSVLLARDGMSRTQISKRLGLNADTIFLWISNARKGTHPTLIRWLELLERAEAMYEKGLVDKITDTALSTQPNTWQSAAWLLERRDPESWGRRDRTDVRVNSDKPLVQVNQLVLTDPDARAASRDFLRRVAGSGADIAIGPGNSDDAEEQ